jgi:hypothetical protein
MMVFDRGIRQAIAVLAVLWAAPAGAQENLYANKTPAQIFATDCAICHKTPQSLSKAGGPLGLGLESFLRSHYTASRESASAIAKYLQAIDAGPATPERRRTAPAAKPAPKKPAEAKAGDKLPGDNKPVPASETKPEAKPVEAKPAEVKPAEAPKPADAPKPAEPAKPAE